MMFWLVHETFCALTQKTSDYKKIILDMLKFWLRFVKSMTKLLKSTKFCPLWMFMAMRQMIEKLSLVPNYLENGQVISNVHIQSLTVTLMTQFLDTVD